MSAHFSIRSGLVVTAVTAALAVTCAVGGTMAWLNAATPAVNNTLTLGSVDLTLDEAQLGGDSGARTTAGNQYTDLEPGVLYDKDPVVHVAAGSRPCYLFIKVTDGFFSQEATPAQLTGYKTIDAQIKANGWAAYTPAKAEPGCRYYLYGGATPVFDPAAAKSLDLPVFTGFAINTDLAGGTVLSGISVKAGAIQSDGFADADAAFAALGL